MRPAGRQPAKICDPESLSLARGRVERRLAMKGQSYKGRSRPTTEGTCGGSSLQNRYVLHMDTLHL
jgi:hypothetical protein